MSFPAQTVFPPPPPPRWLFWFLLLWLQAGSRFNLVTHLPLLPASEGGFPTPPHCTRTWAGWAPAYFPPKTEQSPGTVQIQSQKAVTRTCGHLPALWGVISSSTCVSETTSIREKAQCLRLTSPPTHYSQMAVPGQRQAVQLVCTNCN